MSDIEELIRKIVREELAQALSSTSSTEGEYITPARAAEIASVSPVTIRRWVADGKLPHVRAGRGVRVLRADLEKLLHDGAAKVANEDDLSPEELARRFFG